MSRWRPGSFATFLATGLVAVSPHPSVQAQGNDAFARLPGITLHYVDWGGSGPSCSSDGPRRQCPRLRQPRATFYGPLARVGAHSPRPGAIGRTSLRDDPPTLAGDIRAFLDLMAIEKATLVGFSAAGPK